MSIHEIDPLRDERWAEFLERHPQSSIFHTAGWLQALQRTYGYQPAAFTLSARGQALNSALVFCRVRSWLTGRRIVSLPFSDHCATLGDGEALYENLKAEAQRGREKYAEIRPLSEAGCETAGLGKSASFCLHRLDLRPGLDEILRGFHESCIRRKIGKAKQAGLAYDEGRSEELLRQYYRLALLTRRRHEAPPQPLSWFRNLIAGLGGALKIRVASHQGEPAASIVTLRYKDTMTYKYGCSDPRFHKLGAMQLLFWKAIEEAGSGGLQEFDMGRSDWDNPGLLAFKDRWGAGRSTLTYFRYPAPAIVDSGPGTGKRIVRRIFRSAPDAVLVTAGRLLYPHMG